jgi:hypothetical protein
MRNPVRSETDAFYIAVGCATLIAVSLALGSLVDPLVGVALLVGAVVGGFVWEVPLRTRTAAGRSRKRHPRRAGGSRQRAPGFW